MPTPANQEEFRKLFQDGRAIISLEEADSIVASLSDIELTDSEVQKKFWRGFRPLTMVSRLLGPQIRIRYTGLTNQQFDAVLFDDAAGEHFVECTSIDKMGRHYQAGLIKEIESEDGSWDPRRIVEKRKKSGEIYYCVIDEKEKADFATELVGACSSICQQLYKKLCLGNRLRKDGRKLLQSKIEYYIFCSCEPPFGMIMFDDIEQVILRQLHTLSAITHRRLFFVGRDHVIDSEMNDDPR